MPISMNGTMKSVNDPNENNILTAAKWFSSYEDVSSVHGICDMRTGLNYQKLLEKLKIEDTSDKSVIELIKEKDFTAAGYNDYSEIISDEIDSSNFRRMTSKKILSTNTYKVAAKNPFGTEIQIPIIHHQVCHWLFSGLKIML